MKVQNQLEKMKSLHHTHILSPTQCSNTVVQKINAPLPLVWSMVRQFDNPQIYKKFIKSCKMRSGCGGAGSVREVEVVSGMPAERSTERLDRLDEDVHVMVFSIIGGDHKLVNYQSTTSMYEDEAEEGGGKTVVIESYVVDIPVDSCEEDTCVFADTIVGYNLRSLAKIAEKMA
ncbi:Hypothetical predicted protein [Olea europaea subsp. europaea]|uniref:Uncharacterized protein n=2 Tax=Olea europaea subsp. europaea TaxID=158383 RepID=A0A8S0SZ03_OLEEU|nr:Hypothetical predicted protein [Olea europaea subsp. europaea]